MMTRMTLSTFAAVTLVACSESTAPSASGEPPPQMAALRPGHWGTNPYGAFQVVLTPPAAISDAEARRAFVTIRTSAGEEERVRAHQSYVLPGSTTHRDVYVLTRNEGQDALGLETVLRPWGARIVGYWAVGRHKGTAYVPHHAGFLLDSLKRARYIEYSSPSSYFWIGDDPGPDIRRMGVIYVDHRRPTPHDGVLSYNRGDTLTLIYRQPSGDSLVWSYDYPPIG